MNGMSIEDIERWDNRHALLIRYDEDGRYHERLFTRSLSNVLGDSPYFDLAGNQFDETLLSFRSKMWAIPNGDTLYRYVLRDGVTVTTSRCSPAAGGYGVLLSTYDGHQMFVPMSNIAYAMNLN